MAGRVVARVVVRVLTRELDAAVGGDGSAACSTPPCAPRMLRTSADRSIALSDGVGSAAAG